MKTLEILRYLQCLYIPAQPVLQLYEGDTSVLELLILQVHGADNLSVLKIRFYMHNVFF